MLAGGKAAEQAKIVITHTTCGKVIDLGVADQNNMGAAMAPEDVKLRPSPAGCTQRSHTP